jgi:hypothetical protein
MTDYTLIRSKRKTVALHIRDGSVEVRAPLNMPKRNIDQFVMSKEKWIADKLAKSNERAEKRSSFALAYGSHVTYRGKQYHITERPGNRVGFDESGFYMPPGLAHEQIKHACEQVYRVLAKRDLTEKTLAYAKEMSVSPSAVKINGAKARWGSCSAKKSLNFSWMLIMADDDLIDYVVVHELAHITELNHSERFWALVRGVLPDYSKRKHRLKELQHKLAEESW